MSIPVPSALWPARFEERGPKGDPTILLVGDAKVGAAVFKVSALRVQRDGWGPDYRQDVAADEYDALLESMMEDVENLVEFGQPALIAMGGGHYLLWMVPSSKAKVVM